VKREFEDIDNYKVGSEAAIF